MSYSYIKSVFPNFENSNKVYDESLYSNLQESQVQQQAQAPLQEVKQEQQIVYPQISNNNNVGDFASNTFEKNQVQNNLRYYNIPISDEVKNIEYNNENKYKPYNIKENEYGMDLTEKIQTKEVKLEKLDKLDKLEKFENINELECDIYIKHVSECRKCREIVSRQFNMYDNEEVMEVISYLIFGLFILLAINSIKNN